MSGGERAKAIPGIYAINRRSDGQRIGTVMKVEGEPPASRWWGYSIHRTDPNTENKTSHRTRKEAIAWIVGQDRGAGNDK